MATFQKRGTSWRAIVRKQGQSATATFDTKAQAAQWATATEAKIAAGEPVTLPEAPQQDPGGQTFADLMERYKNEVSPGKRGGRWEQLRLRKLIRDFPEFKKPALQFTGPDIAAWRDKRLAQVSKSTVSRELCLVSVVFTQAIREWGLLLPSNPCGLISKPKKPKPRTQRVADVDRNKIVRQLGWDMESVPETKAQWAAAAFCFALETAMRKGEVLSLTWSEVHKAQRYAHLDMTKNGDERDVPLSSKALALLAKMGPQVPDEQVFKVQSGYLDRLVREARRATGLMHVRFHDTRREATTTFAPKLANVLELAAITGHKDLRMLKIYYAPKPADLAAKLG